MGKHEVSESMSIPEGRHEAEIIKVIDKVAGQKDESGNEIKFNYTDYHFKLKEEGEPEIKMGVPTDIKVDSAGEPTTKHARFLKKMGVELKGIIDTEKLVGTKVSLLTKNVESDRGTFARVDEDTIKPL